MLVDYDKHDLGVSMFEIMIKIQRMYLRRILSETLQFFLLCIILSFTDSYKLKLSSNDNLDILGRSLYTNTIENSFVHFSTIKKTIFFRSPPRP